MVISVVIFDDRCWLDCIYCVALATLHECWQWMVHMWHNECLFIMPSYIQTLPLASCPRLCIQLALCSRHWCQFSGIMQTSCTATDQSDIIICMHSKLLYWTVLKDWSSIISDDKVDLQLYIQKLCIGRDRLDCTHYWHRVYYTIKFWTLHRRVVKSKIKRYKILKRQKEIQV